MPSYAASVVDNRDMPTICVQDMLAVAVVAGRLGFDEAHSTSLLHDPRVRRVRGGIEVVRDPDLDREQPHGRGSRVTIESRAGSVAMKVEHPRGHRFRTPAPTWPDLREKWEEVLVPRIGAARFDEFSSACMALETVDSVGELSGFLAAAARR